MLVTAALAVLTALGAVVPTSALPGVTASVDNPDERSTWAVTPADADGPDGRGRFDLLVEPGGLLEEHVAVRNLGNEELTVGLFVQDATQVPGNDFGVLSADDPASAVGAWVELAQDSVTVPPRDSVVVPITLRVPADAEPGDHAGGILAVNEVSADDGSPVHYQVGTRVYLRVAGQVSPELDIDAAAVHEGRLSPFALGSTEITATVANTGNVRVQPQVRARVSALFGWWEATVPLDGVPEMLPDGTADTSGALDGVPALGPLWVTTEVTHAVSGNQNVTDSVAVSSTTTVVWAVPWVLLAAVLALLVAAVIALRNLRQRRAHAATELSSSSE